MQYYAVPEHEMATDFPKVRPNFLRNYFFRRRKFREIFNINHYKVCTIENEKFHNHLTVDCNYVFIVDGRLQETITVNIHSFNFLEMSLDVKQQLLSLHKKKTK